MNIFIKTILFFLASLLFSCSSTNTAQHASQVNNQTNLFASFQDVKKAQPRQQRDKQAVITNQHKQNTQSVKYVRYYQSYHQEHLINDRPQASKRSLFARNIKNDICNEQISGNSLADRELMLSFYRAGNTVDENLITQVIAEEVYFVENNYTGYESMYVRSLATRGTTELDPVTLIEKKRLQQKNARFGLTIASR